MLTEGLQDTISCKSRRP